MVGKNTEYRHGGNPAHLRLRRGIELVAFHRAGVAFVCVLPARLLRGDGGGLVAGGFGRRHNGWEPGGLLSGGSPLVVKFSEGMGFCGAGSAGLSVPAVPTADTHEGVKRSVPLLNHLRSCREAALKMLNSEG